MKITDFGREAFLSIYSATVGAGVHGEPGGGEFQRAYQAEQQQL
mgnify:CR=1 FL=1